MILSKTDYLLSDITDNVAKELGWDEGSARFIQSKFFQTRWTCSKTFCEGRRKESIQLGVTDYMRNAPEFILEEYVRSQLVPLSKEHAGLIPPCSDEFLAYLESDAFLLRGQKMYWFRSPNISTEPSFMLDWACEWLENHSLMPDVAIKPTIAWNKAVRNTGHSSTHIMMKVVEIPYRMLGDEQVLRPELIWTMYRQLCQMATPFDPINFSHEEDCREMYRRFPEDIRKEAERKLQKRGMWTKDMSIE